MLGAQVVVCLGVFKTIRPTGIMAGRIHVAPALITRSGPFFIRCGSGAADLLSLYTCDITTGEISWRGWRRWCRRRGEKKPADASLDPQELGPVFGPYPTFNHKSCTLSINISSHSAELVSVCFIANNADFCLSYWSFCGDLHQN